MSRRSSFEFFLETLKCHPFFVECLIRNFFKIEDEKFCCGKSIIHSLYIILYIIFILIFFGVLSYFIKSYVCIWIVPDYRSYIFLESVELLLGYSFYPFSRFECRVFTSIDLPCTFLRVLVSGSFFTFKFDVILW